MIRRSHILTTAALLAVCATPASAATYEDLRGSKASSGEVAPPPSLIAAGAESEYQDLRTPDAVDAAAHRGLYEQDKAPYALNRDWGSPDAVDAARDLPPVQAPYALNRDWGSPDAVDAARDLPPVQTPAPVVTVDEPSSGFDWGDAGIGAAGMFGLFSIAGGSALLLAGRKRRHGVHIATH